MVNVAIYIKINLFPGMHTPFKMQYCHLRCILNVPMQIFPTLSLRVVLFGFSSIYFFLSSSFFSSILYSKQEYHSLENGVSFKKIKIYSAICSNIAQNCSQPNTYFYKRNTLRNCTNANSGISNMKKTSIAQDYSI